MLVELVMGILSEGAATRGASLAAGCWVTASSTCILLAELSGDGAGVGTEAGELALAGTAGFAGSLPCNWPGSGGGVSVFGASMAAAASF